MYCDRNLVGSDKYPFRIAIKGIDDRVTYIGKSGRVGLAMGDRSSPSSISPSSLSSPLASWNPEPIRPIRSCSLRCISIPPKTSVELLQQTPEDEIFLFSSLSYNILLQKQIRYRSALSLSLSLYIYIYMCVCVYVCVLMYVCSLKKEKNLGPVQPFIWIFKLFS